MNFTCPKCGEVWDQDPLDLIECPVCGEVLPRPASPHTVTAMRATAIEPQTVIRPASTATAPRAAAAEEEGFGEKTTINPGSVPPVSASVTPTQLSAPPPRTPTPRGGDGEGEINDRTTRIGVDSAEGFSKPPTATPTSSGFSAPPPRTPRPAGASAPTAKAPSGGLAAEMQHMIGKTVGGYKIEGLLGVGGMGAVFLAHQISLDRKVALKLLPARFAANAELLARFVREALSAAQLNHHNIVQVFDVGSEGDTHYISMEYVRGDTLAGSVKKDGRLQFDDAAGYVLQAARGLHYAHERGIIHRDIKPGNLMLNEFGIVKIADMGLAKMRGTTEKAAPAQLDSPAAHRAMGAQGGELTMHDIAMGTPSYMAPEQARDASSVDHRADQYSLGCTLYYLVTGATPFSGNSAIELITKHQKEAPPPLEAHVKNVPPALASVVERMLAKQAGDRYPTLLDVVHDLEAYLGVESDKGAYSPREQHLTVLDRELKAYYAVPAAQKRRIAVASFTLAVPALIVLAILMSQFKLASGLLGLYALTGIANFIVEGLRTRNHLFRRTRAVFFGMSVAGWVKLGSGIALGVVMLAMLGWLVPWLGFAVVGLGLAAAYQTFIIRKLRAQRAEPILRMQTMLRDLRVRGVSEEALHDFVARFSAADWEEFFEELFGYEAMITARAKWATGESPLKRQKFATWRDPLDRWLDSVEEARKNARERKELAKVEAGRLKAQGVSTQDAEKQAELEATKILEQDAARQFNEKAKTAFEQIEVKRGKQRGGLISKLVKGVAFVLGAAIVLLGAGKLGYAPDPTGGLLSALGYAPNFLTGLITAVAGAVLILSAFSAHPINRVLIAAGALLVAGGPQLAALLQQPPIQQYGLYIGVILLCIGFVFNVLAKLNGKQF